MVKWYLVSSKLPGWIVTTYPTFEACAKVWVEWDLLLREQYPLMVTGLRCTMFP